MLHLWIALAIIILIIAVWFSTHEGWTPGQAYAGPSSASAPSAPAPSAPSGGSTPSVPYNAGQGAGHQGYNRSIGAYGGGWSSWHRRPSYVSPYMYGWGQSPYLYAPPVTPYTYYLPWHMRWQGWFPWQSSLPDCEDVNYAVPCYDGRA